MQRHRKHQVMIVFITLKHEGYPHEAAKTEILGVYHTRNQAIRASLLDCGDEEGKPGCDDWTHCWESNDSSGFYMSYEVSRHEVPKATFTKRPPNERLA
jgi:hypothetical protein